MTRTPFDHDKPRGDARRADTRSDQPRRATAGALLAMFLWFLSATNAAAFEHRDVLFTTEVSAGTLGLLLEALESPETSVRSQALAALRQVGRRETAPSIVPLLQDKSPAVRAEAVTTLEAILPPAEAASHLLRACSDPSDRVARRALSALAECPGIEGYEALVRADATVAPALRSAWADALARRDERPPEALVGTLLADSDPGVRSAAAILLGRDPALAVDPVYLRLLEDGDALVRARAIESLGLGTGSAEVHANLIRALEDPAPWVRRAALNALESQPPPLNTLRPLLADPDATVRTAAVNVAGRPEEAEETLLALIDALADHELFVAEAAAARLASTPGDEVEAALTNLLDDATEQVAAMAVLALGLSERSTVVTALRPMVEHSSPWVRRRAYEAFGRLRDRAVVPLLLEHAAKEAAVPRAALNAALGRLGDGRAIPHLLDDINYPDEKSRGLIPRLPALSRIPLPYSREQTAVASAALRALGEIGDPVAVGALLEVAYDSARDSSYFDNLAWSLGVLGDHQAANVLETIGVRGALIHGQYIVAMADSSRVEALRSIGRLRLEEMVPKIRSIDPLRCSLSVREAAAEVLSVLTGERYAARLPVQLEHFFLEANDDPADINAPRQPIVFLVGQGPGD